MIGKGDGWKKILIATYYLMRNKNISEFTLTKLSTTINVDKSVVRKDLMPRVLNQELARIKRVHKNTFIYKLTKEGKKISNEILTDWRNNHKKAFKNFVKKL